MKIVVDTNVLISATFWTGSSFSLLNLVESGQLTLVLSHAIIEEYQKVLLYSEILEKIKNKGLVIRNTVAKVISLAQIVKPVETLSVVQDDPDDNKILECAKAGNVSFIISSDKHLLRLTNFDAIPIVTPEHFLKHLEKH
jgi:hypothetical protein